MHRRRGPWLLEPSAHDGRAGTLVGASFDRRLVGRVAAARRTLAVCVAAGLVAAALVAIVAALGRAGPRGRAERPAHGHQGHVGPAGRAGLPAPPPRRRPAGPWRERRAGRRRRPGGRRPGDLLRPLPPQVVLAVVVPVAVLCWTAVDRTSALLMAVTLPVIPVFMAPSGGRPVPGRGRTSRPWRAVGLVPGRGAWPAEPAGLQPGERPAGRDPRGDRPVPAHDHGHAAPVVPLRRGPGPGRHALDRAGGRHLDVRLVAGSLGLRPALTVLLLVVPELHAPRSGGGQLVPRQRRRAGRHRTHPGRPWAVCGHPEHPTGVRLRSPPGAAHRRVGFPPARQAEAVRAGLRTWSTWTSSPASWWPWSEPAEPATPPLAGCCSGSPGPTRGSWSPAAGP